MTVRTPFAIAASVFLALSGSGCGDDDHPSGPSEAVSSRAYKGHANDQDMDNLAATYPKIIGTRLDDCQSCHAAGSVTSGGRDRYKNACDFCHYIFFPDPDATGAPETYEETLNPYGLAYKEAGRNEGAIEAIEGLDSDEDGFSNQAEIEAGRYPGSATSTPDQPMASLRVLEWEEVTSIGSHSQFMLANSHRQENDEYATYTGVTIRDLLTHLGVDLAETTGITVIASDGYMKDFGLDTITASYPKGTFYAGLGAATLGAECGFVIYPMTMPDRLADLSDGELIPDEPWLMLASERDGAAMDPSYLDPVSGKIEGEGPYRIIVPQSTPGAPDRGSQYSPSGCDDGYDYEESKDHNAGNMVRGVVAIRVNPMPDGYEEFDHMNGGWAYVDARELIIYGKGIE